MDSTATIVDKPELFFGIQQELCFRSRWSWCSYFVRMCRRPVEVSRRRLLCSLNGQPCLNTFASSRCNFNTTALDPHEQVEGHCVRRKPRRSLSMKKWRNCTFVAIQLWCCDHPAGRVPDQRQTKSPPGADIKWLCQVSVGLKIHAESSSNGSSRPASRITGRAKTAVCSVRDGSFA